MLQPRFCAGNRTDCQAVRQLMLIEMTNCFLLNRYLMPLNGPQPAVLSVLNVQVALQCNNTLNPDHGTLL